MTPRGRSRITLPALLVAALALFASACGSDDGGTADAGGATDTASGRGGTLVIAMTAGDIPQLDTVLTGQQGYEGYRFVGNQLYDGLTRFDLSQGDEVPRIVPSLAESWTPDDTATTWTFTLRKGVTFQDGTPWNADAAVFNFERYTKPDHPFFSQALTASAGLSLAGVSSVAKVDDYTITITGPRPDSHLPSDLATIYMASPTALQKAGADGFATHPVGTGPFEFVSLQRGQRLELAANPDYWAGAPKLDRLVLRPIPDPAARIAALRSGEVDWIEVPSPDDWEALGADGFQTLTNSYDHIWPWIFDVNEKPWNDVRVRQAANYAIDRAALSGSLLHGTAEPAAQLTPRANASYDDGGDRYDYDPAKAKALLADAGYSEPVKATVSIPTGGSGNMIPGPMNEALQQDLAKVGIDVELEPIEWAAMIQSFTSGKIPDGASALNFSLTFQSEGTWGILFDSRSPVNVGPYPNPKVDDLLGRAQATVDDAARGALYAQASKLITDDAAWLFVVNDLNPRVLAPDVHGFVQPKSWFCDLTTVWVG